MSASTLRILHFACYDIENKCIISTQKDQEFMCAVDRHVMLYTAGILLSLISCFKELMNQPL